MKKLKLFFHTQNLRYRISHITTAIEIFLAFAMIVWIIFLSIQIFFDIRDTLFTVLENKKLPPISELLSLIFSLVIGLEFIKMLVKQNPASAVEVVLFAIARKIIIDHGNMVDTFLGVLSMAALFAINKFLIDNKKTSGEYIVNGGTSIHEINRHFNADFDEIYGNTVAGYLFNYLKRDGKVPSVGLQTVIGNYVFVIYEMDNELIRYIKIFEKPEN